MNSFDLYDVVLSSGIGRFSISSYTSLRLFYYFFLSIYFFEVPGFKINKDYFDSSFSFRAVIGIFDS